MISDVTEDLSSQDQGVALTIMEDWQVQGRKSLNPFKVKKQVGTLSQQVSKKARHHPQEKPAYVVESCLKGKKQAGTATFKDKNQGVSPRTL